MIFFSSFLSAKKKEERTISVKFLDSSQAKQNLIQIGRLFWQVQMQFF